MRIGFQLVVVLVCVLTLSSVVASVASPSSPPVVPMPLSSGSSMKFNVIEIFTGTWCPYCVFADGGMTRLADEYAENTITLFWHCCAPANDPYYDAGVYGPRDIFYTDDPSSSMVFPTVFFNGGGARTDAQLIAVGAGTSSGAYDTYRIKMEDLMDTSSNMALTINADLASTTVYATISVYASDAVTQANLQLRTVVYEDALYYMGGNGAPFHRNVVRALNEQLLTIAQGQTVTKSVSFAIPPGNVWNLNKLGIASFVQSNNKQMVVFGTPPNDYPFTISDIINGARVNLVPRGILVHLDRGTTADYTDYYEKLLSNAATYPAENFDTWNVHALGTDTGSIDDRGTPTQQAMDEVGLVIWDTGGVAAPSQVLTATERGRIGTHLDNGGNLLLTGAGIGFEGWTAYRAWFQQYLHAIYESDDTGATSVTGKAGDPIGDPFSAMTLNIGASPDRINGMVEMGTGVPFLYPGPLPAGVRALHGMSSSVVYLGFRYFETTEANRRAVLDRIIDYADAAAGPHVSMVYPAGGEQIDPGANVDIRWTARDVRIPTNGVDIYFNPNYPTGAWQTIATGEPNDGRYQWILPDVNSAACRIRVVVRDVDPSSPDGEGASDFTCGNPYFQVLFSDLGWHLISYPLVVPDTSISSVFATITGSYGAVRWYDPSDLSDPWKAYIPAKSGGDLQYVDYTMGVWIEITAPCTLQIMGDRPTTSPMVPIRSGWNLIGFPSANAAYTVANLMTDTGVTRVEGYSAATTPYYLQLLTGATTLQQGQGYWVYNPGPDTLWTVPL